MRVLATSARILASLTRAVSLVPAVDWLTDVGVAGAWTWLAGCLALVAGLAGCSAVVVWWPQRRMRVVAGVAALAWGTLVLSVAYWPAVTTRADIRAAFDRIQYDGSVVDPTIWELGPGWCSSTYTSVLGCPRLTADFLVEEGGSQDVLRALDAAGYHLVGESGPRQVEDFDLPMSGSTGTGSRYWFAGEGMRLQVTVVSERQLGVPMLDGDATMLLSTGTETVSVEISDAENSARLEIPDDLGVWSPHPSLDDLQPPPGW